MRALLVVAMLGAIAVPGFAQTSITLWRHEATIVESRASRAAIDRFNASQPDWDVRIEQLPQATYTQSITAAALSGRLPCVLEVDSPIVPNFAWTGHLRSLDGLLDRALLDRVQPTALGTYRGTVYSIGQFDAPLALYARRSLLTRLSIRVPTMAEPWTRAEFDAALTAIRAETGAYVVDLQVRAPGEWWPYAFSPLLQSFGGDLVERRTMLSAEGVLNGAAALSWGRWFQSLFERDLANRRPADQKEFSQGRTAMAYNGVWAWPEYRAAWGDDLIVLPPVDMGQGPVIGGGSWQWGIGAACRHPDAAAALIAFLMRDDEVAAMSRATGLVPVTEAAAALTEDYRVGGPGRRFFDFIAAFARRRPETPGYPFISSAFTKAARDIRDGKDVQDVLDDAVDAIERNIADNRGYGFAERAALEPPP